MINEDDILFVAKKFAEAMEQYTKSEVLGYTVLTWDELDENKQGIACDIAKHLYQVWPEINSIVEGKH